MSAVDSPRTVLVCMPWHELTRPSLALGLLKASCVAHEIAEPATCYANIGWAERLLDAGLTVRDYLAISDGGFVHALGEWVFAGALNGPDFGVEQMADYARRHEIDLGPISRMRELADDFVSSVADAVLAMDPEIVGFTSTFSQSVPSLSVAKRIKERAPQIRTVLGGYNTEGIMGATLHREFEFVDLVLRGESDNTFPELLGALGSGRSDLGSIAGLCWRDADGIQRVNDHPGKPVGPADMRVPLFDDWFRTYDDSVISELTEPELVLESSRGCWWGEKHHCTFCGLNGSTMSYRAKQPAAFVTELDHIVRKHKVLDVTVVDNILDVSYLRTALPAIAETNVDLRLHYEIKANITAEQAATMRAARVWSVQPGIESLVDDALRRMDKGIGGARNVRALRDLESEGITVGWNWLYGFPGERVDDYRNVIEQIPALAHLQPPGGTSRIFLERFSPNFDDPAIGFTERLPAERYQLVYDLDRRVLADLVYEFDTPDHGITQEQVAPLDAAIAEWQAQYPQSSLLRREVDGMLIIRDRRFGWAARDHVFTDPRERETWVELEHGRTISGLHRSLAAAGFSWDAAELAQWLATQLEYGLVFTEGGRWLALATTPGGIERSMVRPEQPEPVLVRLEEPT
ncbi:RiPP maturation radical SAM C-methyltransferase [Nocardia sp. NPDC052254]|uniref:RiPP maturation radical SAM C-methyltransferase n=1 Tax=Nocardia sp. NPDC052254 TaxID=3155681 RepID=UPI003433AB10